jgi:hypothetical protein
MNITATFEKHGNRCAERVARYVGKHPGHLDELLSDMISPTKRVKNAAAKTVRILSESDPELLAPHTERFEELMGGDDTIVKWIAVDVIGNLAAVDPDLRIRSGTLRSLYTMLGDDSMVTASHAIDSLGKIAEGHPRLRRRITGELARVEDVRRSADCRNILLGRVLQSYGRYWAEAGKTQQAEIASFVERQRKNRFPATRKKAERLLGRRS